MQPRLVIRKCPDCAELVHFDPEKPVRRCRQCGALYDFSKVRIWPEPQLMSLRCRLDRALPEPGLMLRVARLALLLTIAPAATMLLATNSLDVDTRGDYVSHFTTIRVETGIDLCWGWRQPYTDRINQIP